jgi:thioredoxin reductase (NADPH)
VFIVGAGNSAGQAAIYLAKSARSVTLLVRGDDLAKSMSDYLVTEIEAIPAVHVRLHTEVAAARGDHRLTELVLNDRAAGREETVPAAALFVMIGATPHAGRLPGDILRDQHGFVLTGRDLAGDDRAQVGQPVPLPLESSVPGCLRSATCAPGRSSASPRPSGKDRSPSRRCTSTCCARPRGRPARAPEASVHRRANGHVFAKYLPRSTIARV